MAEKQKSPRTTPKVVDVARIAGVSTATVSRVLNDPEKVSQTTRDAVLAAVKETGYRVNRAARNLRTNSSRSILALVPNLSNPFFSNILSGLERELNAEDYSLLVTDSGDALLTSDQMDRLISAGQADGLIVLDGSISRSDFATVQADNPSCPVVFACEWVEDVKCPSVRADNVGGVQKLVDHLWENGHRRFGHVMGPASNVLAQVRRDAFMSRVQELGGETRQNWILAGDFSIAAGRAAADQIGVMRDTPTAWICASDQIAFGLISGLTRAGFNVPTDMSVTGFDNIEMAEVFNPPLTTIHQSRNQMGHSAARTMLELIRGQKSDARVHILPVHLVDRDSTGPVPC
ncbi:HTH-type transcriptional repressor CytR [Shimia sp. SK013]|uniref:LacI family DNA-binding transcriptional regulator n=1 Tax=Shimia sp. SK013 TaxID=1389006 RepID=UPI0006B432B1|nr:LacI family DNA-binding transcriptional regulator [Shimia sp. SK013]KPA20378.1 HTH-type transcriptional repressor CytR [Shimia sp. SK013]